MRLFSLILGLALAGVGVTVPATELFEAISTVTIILRSFSWERSLELAQ